MTKLIRRLLPCVLLSLSLVNGWAQQPLRFNLKAGERFLFSSAMTQRIQQEAMGQQITTLQDMRGDYEYLVKSTANELTTIEVTFKTIKMDTDIGGMQRLSFDSEKPGEGTAELKTIGNLIGKVFTMTVSAKGEVLDVKGLDDVINNIGDAQDGLLSQNFGDSAMIQSMNQMINIYPNRPVKRRHLANVVYAGPIAGLMQMTVSSSYTLAGIEGDLAILNVTGALSFSKLNGGGGNPMLQNAEITMDGTQNGTIEVHYASGLPLKSSINQNITGELSIQGMKIPMTIVSDMVTTGKKL